MRLMTVKEFAKMTKLDELTVRRRLRSRDWPFLRFGQRSIRVDFDTLVKLAKASAQDSAQSSQATK
jgi:excisionase family DNA binding protein